MVEWLCASWHFDGVFHALAALSPGQALLLLIALLVFTACLDALERRRNSLPMLGIKPC
jgi:hypothetical protein